MQATGIKVIIACNLGNPHAELANSCTHEKFLSGRFHDIVNNDFGSAVLAEVFAAVSAAPSYPPLNACSDNVNRTKGCSGLRAYCHSIVKYM